MLSEFFLKSIDKHFIIVYFISIIITLNIKYAKADIALGHLYPDMFINTPKTWYQYIRMTIVRFLEFTQYSYTNRSIQQFRSGLFKWSKIVLQLRYREIKMSSLSDKKLKITTYITGQFILHSDKTYNHYFMYNIDTRLRLNVTFVIISFIYNFDYYLNVYKVPLRILDGEKNASFQFYGHHSPFNFYPYFIKVPIILDTSMMTGQPFALNFIFTVMDQYIVYSISNIYFDDLDNVNNRPPDLVYSISHETIVPSYFIQVRKISYIVLSFEHNLTFAYVVYDGPGFSSNLIVLKSNVSKIISTSTFQCIIQLKIQSSLRKYPNIIMYRSNYLNNNNSIFIDLTNHTNMTVQLPNTMCLDNLCVVDVNTETDLQINVTFNKIVSEGIYNPTCKYGGIVTEEYLNNEYDENPTICQNHSGQIKQARSMYSSTSSLVLILYWYSMYQNIMASLTLSLTRCKPVTIDLCELQSLCGHELPNYDENSLIPPNADECDSFLNNVKERSNMNFSRDAFLGLVTAFSQYGNKCTIVRFSSKNFHFSSDYSSLECHAHLVPASYCSLTHFEANKQIEFTIKGNFGKYPRMADSVQLLGQPEKLDVYSPQLNYTGNRYNKRIFSSCHIYAQINTSRYYEDFRISISLSLLDSWIDIIVNQTVPISSKFVGWLNPIHIATLNFKQQQQHHSFQKTRCGTVLLLEFGGKGSNELIPSDIMINIDMVKDLGNFSFRDGYLDGLTMPVFNHSQQKKDQFGIWNDILFEIPLSRICK